MLQYRKFAEISPSVVEIRSCAAPISLRFAEGLHHAIRDRLDNQFLFRTGIRPGATVGAGVGTGLRTGATGTRIGATFAESAR